MQRRIFASGLAYTETTLTDGKSLAFSGTPRTDANTPPRFTLAISFSAVLAFENPGDHHRTAVLCGEYCRAPNITNGSGDEHRLTGPNSGAYGDQLVTSCCNQRQSSGLDEIEPRGNLGKAGCLDDAKFGIRPVGHREHLVADSKSRHSGPDFEYRSGEVYSNDAGKLDRSGIFCGSRTPHYVERVDARGSDSHQYFTRSRNWIRILFEFQFFGPAIFVNNDCFHYLPPLCATWSRACETPVTSALNAATSSAAANLDRLEKKRVSFRPSHMTMDGD